MRNKLKAHATCVLRIALAHVLLIPGADAAMPQLLLARGSFSPRPALHLFSYFHFNALQPWCPCTLARQRTPPLAAISKRCRGQTTRACSPHLGFSQSVSILPKYQREAPHLCVPLSAAGEHGPGRAPGAARCLSSPAPPRHHGGSTWAVCPSVHLSVPSLVCVKLWETLCKGSRGEHGEGRWVLLSLGRGWGEGWLC